MRIAHWPGHQVQTSLVVEALLRRCAAESAPQVSRAERVLYTACEFWAAAMNRALRQHLGRPVVARLRAGEESFVTIGAHSVAATLRLARTDLTAVTPAVPLHKVVSGIEEALARTDDLVDELIAQFAIELLRQRS
jgi:hypothetical protein